MRKNYRRAAPPPRKQYRINAAITAQEVRLIDEDGVHKGVFPVQEALAYAQETELDLIEIEPTAAPPVCKIMDFGRLKYSLDKELRKQKAHQKKVEVKGIRLSLRIGEHDRMIRKNQAQKFLDQNDKIRIDMVLRGRERQHMELAKKGIESFINELKTPYGDSLYREGPITAQGGRLSIVLGVKKS